MRLLSLPLDTPTRDLASLPFQLGGCGLLSAMRSRVPAHWASWADSLRTIHCRHPALADLVRNLSEPTGFRHDEAASCREVLCNRGYGAPGWRVLLTAHSRRFGRGMHPRSWSRSSWTPCCLGSMTSARCSAPQGGSLAALPFAAMPVSPQQRFDSDIFRVLLLLFPCLPTLARVAILSTALAITVQVVRGQVCWGGWVSLWSSCMGLPRGWSESLNEHFRSGFGR